MTFTKFPNKIFIDLGEGIEEYPCTDEQYDRLLPFIYNGNRDKVNSILTELIPSEVPPAKDVVLSLLDHDYFYSDGEAVYRKGINLSIPNAIGKLYLEAIEGDYLSNIDNFWFLCSQNKNPHSREQIYPFISANNIRLTPSGLMIVYRWVKDKEENLYTDYHTSSMEIRLREPVSLVRNDCDADASSSCSKGLHVAGAEWASRNSFGNVKIVALVNPKDVVAVPQYDAGKMRTCRYFPCEVIESFNGHELRISSGELNMSEYESEYFNIINDELKDELIESENLVEVSKHIRVIKKESAVKRLKDIRKELDDRLS